MTMVKWKTKILRSTIVPFLGLRTLKSSILFCVPLRSRIVSVTFSLMRTVLRSTHHQHMTMMSWTSCYCRVMWRMGQHWQPPNLLKRRHTRALPERFQFQLRVPPIMRLQTLPHHLQTLPRHHQQGPLVHWGPRWTRLGQQVTYYSLSRRRATKRGQGRETHPHHHLHHLWNDRAKLWVWGPEAEEGEEPGGGGGARNKIIVIL